MKHWLVEIVVTLPEGEGMSLESAATEIEPLFRDSRFGFVGASGLAVFDEKPPCVKPISQEKGA